MNEIMVSLLVESSMSLYSARDNVLNKNYNIVGIWTCPHSSFGTMTVANYANDFELSGTGLIERQ